MSSPTKEFSAIEYFLELFGSCSFQFIILGLAICLVYFKWVRKRIDNLGRRIPPQYPRLSSFTVLFVSAFIFSICVEIILHQLRDTCRFVLLVNAESAAVDWAMNVWVRREPSSQKDLEPLIWVDIDEATYHAMGEPLTIPRPSIRELIEQAVCAPAKLVIVDIALDRYISPTDEDMTRADESVSRYLQYYSKKASEHRNSASDNGAGHVAELDCVNGQNGISFPHIILAKDLKKIGSQESTPQFEERRSEIDDLETTVDKSPVLHWGSTTFELDHDYVVRKWRLFEPTYKTVKTNNDTYNKYNTLLSIPLLAWTILRQPDLGNEPFEAVRFKDLLYLFPPTDESSKDSKRSCFTDSKQSMDQAHSWTLTKKLSDGTTQSIQLCDMPNEVAQRVAYLIGNGHEPWPSPTLPKTDSRANPVPLFGQMSAFRLLASDGNSDSDIALNQLYLKNKVVVIGSSYEDSRDFHLTPIGRIPGALWMINAIESLMEYGEMRQTSKFEKYGSILLSLLAVSFFFAILHSRPLLASFFTGLVMLAFVFYSLRELGTGAWLEFTLPYFGVLIHFLVEQITSEKLLHGDEPVH